MDAALTQLQRHERGIHAVTAPRGRYRSGSSRSRPCSLSSGPSRVANGRRLFQGEQPDGLLAHLEFADLAGGGHGELVHHDHVARDLVACEPSGGDFPDLSAVGGSAPGRILTQAHSSSPYLTSGTPIT